VGRPRWDRMRAMVWGCSMCEMLRMVLPQRGQIKMVSISSV
jgi:hypothetical protein